MPDTNSPEAVSQRTGLPLSDFTAYDGTTEPPGGVCGPGHVYVGSLRRGRICFLTTGKRLKVLDQYEGSTLVQGPGEKKLVGERAFTAKSKPYTISRSTIVRFTKEAIR